MKPISSIAVAALIAVCSIPTSLADEQAPSYAGQANDLMHLDNGMVVESRDIQTPDGYTSGFRIIAGFSPITLPRLDLGAELSYRESDEVPMQQGDQTMILHTTSLGGSLVAGLRLGRLGLFAKSGFASWEGDPVSPHGFPDHEQPGDIADPWLRRPHAVRSPGQPYRTRGDRCPQHGAPESGDCFGALRFLIRSF